MQNYILEDVRTYIQTLSEYTGNTFKDVYINFNPDTPTTENNADFNRILLVEETDDPVTGSGDNFIENTQFRIEVFHVNKLTARQVCKKIENNLIGLNGYGQGYLVDPDTDSNAVWIDRVSIRRKTKPTRLATQRQKMNNSLTSYTATFTTRIFNKELIT